MKKFIYSLLGFAIAFSGLSAIAAARVMPPPPPGKPKPPRVIIKPQPAGDAAWRIKLENALRQASHFKEGQEVPIYRLESVNLKALQAEAATLANRTREAIGGEQAFSEKALKADGDYFFARAGGLKLRAYGKSGFIALENWEQIYRGECRDLTLGEAEKIARKFISDHSLLSLLPQEELACGALRRVRSQAVAVGGGAPTNPVLNNVIVILGRKLNGWPVFGPGGKLVLFLSGPGEVVGFQRNWRKVEPIPVDRVKAVGPARAAERILAELHSIFGKDLPPLAGVTIELAEGGYYAANKRQSQKYLQPGYTVHLVIDHNPGTSAIGIVVSGAERTLEPLAPAPSAGRGQSRPGAEPTAGGDD